MISPVGRAILSTSVVSICIFVRHVDAEVIYGGPTFDGTTGTGFLFPSLPSVPGSTAGSGIGVGRARKYNSNTDLGTRSFRWDATGAPAIELGNLGQSSSGVSLVAASAINAAGITVGGADKYSANTNLGLRAVRWDADGTAATELENLGTNSSGATFSSATAINASGVIIGFANKYSGNTNLGSRAVRWNPTITELGNIGTNNSGGTDSRANDVNAVGTAVGYAYKYSGNSSRGYRGVRWDAGGTTATELDSLGTNSTGVTDSQALAINALGTSIGYANKYSANTNLGRRAVRWDAPGTVATELGILGTDSSGTTNSDVYAINDAGTAVGYATKYIDNIHRGTRAVRWDAVGSNATELGTLGVDSNGVAGCRAYAINAGGIAVGNASKYNDTFYVGQRAVFWGHDGVAVDLNTLLSPSDAAVWTLIEAWGISDTNWVTGIGDYDPDGTGGLGAYKRMFLIQINSVDCDSIDFNNDTSLFDPQDIDAFLSVYSEGPCVPSTATCNDIDFNNDTSVFDPCDINSFLVRYSEGPCTPCGS